MRKMFAGYYRPSNLEFRNLWDKCLFVLDANVLLNLYRYSEDTGKKLIEILRQVETRLWVPHQAALEYQKNRLDVISAQREAYKHIGDLLADAAKKLDAQLRTYKRHPLIDTQRIASTVGRTLEEQVQELKSVREKHPDLLETDHIRVALTKLLSGRVGPPYKDERMKEIFKEGEIRYAKCKPPGYKDAKAKDGDRAYGDLVLWYQVIDKAAEEKTPIIIVTDDVKEDWWWRHEGKIVGPNPDLIDEMREKADVSFYMYVSDQFMEYAREYLKKHVDQEAIDEIREVRRHDEQQRLEVERFLMMQERRLAESRSERRSLDAETEHLRSQISAATSEIDRILLGPDDVRKSQGARELLERLVNHRSEMEQRVSFLEQRRRILEGELEALASRLHHGATRLRPFPRYRLVRHATGDSASRIPVVDPKTLEAAEKPKE